MSLSLSINLKIVSLVGQIDATYGNIKFLISNLVKSCNTNIKIRGRSRIAATSKMELFVIMLEAVNYYHKVLHVECCSSPRSASENGSIKSNVYRILCNFHLEIN